jgi:predicted TIM-barrel fold metal-dependent hydrolase
MAGDDNGGEADSVGTDFSRPILFALALFLLGANVATYLLMEQRVEGARALAGHAAPDGAAVPSSDTTSALDDYRVINGHDHLYKEEHLEKYFLAADKLGVEKSLFVASSEFTIMGEGSKITGNEENTREILRCAEKYPGKIIPFATVHPDEENKLEKVKNYVASGAKGLKLYTGHGTFYEKPLTDPSMDELYAYCESEGVVLCWHINLLLYREEFTRVLLRYPNLKVIIPHFGVTFYRPESLNLIGGIMDQYPNVYTDTSFGTRDILVSGLEIVSAGPAVFRAFYEKYQDRIIFGTDMVVTGNKEKTPEWIASVLQACRDMHEKEEYFFWMAAPGSGYGRQGVNNVYGRLRGLNLPKDILEKVYATNLERILGDAPAV